MQLTTIRIKFSDLYSAGNTTQLPKANLAAPGVAAPTHKLIYNAQGQLAELRDNNNVTIATYVYRGDGKRAWKELANGQRSYFYYAGETLIAGTNGVDVSSLQLWGADGLIGARTTNSTTQVTTKSYNLYDTQGNLAQTINARNGNLLSKSAVNAWGEPIRDSAGNAAGAGYGAKFGYVRDGESGFYLCTLRYYDASGGRWLTRDPIGYAGGSNLYGYVGNDPVNFADSLGLSRDIGGGSGTVRFSFATFIPYPRVKDIFGKVFNGNSRGPSSASTSYKTQINGVINLKNHTIKFVTDADGPTIEYTTGWTGQGTYNECHGYRKTPFGYEVHISGTSVIPFYPKTGAPIWHAVTIYFDNNGNFLDITGTSSGFPSRELWTYRGASGTPHLVYQFNVNKIGAKSPLWLATTQPVGRWDK